MNDQRVANTTGIGEFVVAETEGHSAEAQCKELLEARNVSLVYKTRTGTIAALKDLSLTVRI